MSTEESKVTSSSTNTGTTTNAALTEGAKEVTQKYTEEAQEMPHHPQSAALCSG